MRLFKVYLYFLLITFLVGYSSAVLSPPGAWYAALAKPWFTPPNWVFPIAWTLLYVMIAIAGARVWLVGLLGLPFLFWVAQIALNALWSYLFFGLQASLVALIGVMVLLMCIVGFIKTTWQTDKIASLLFVPYGAWVAFATVLNAAIWMLNP